MSKSKRTRRPAAKRPQAPTGIVLPNIVSTVQLMNIRLIHSETKLVIKGGKPPERAHVSITNGVGLSKDDKTLRATVSCAIDSAYEDDREPSVFVHCSFELLYAMAGDNKLPTKTELKSQEQNVISMIMFQSWPYIREFVHRSYLSMSLPPVVLPPLRMGTDNTGTLVIDVAGATSTAIAANK